MDISEKEWARYAEKLGRAARKTADNIASHIEEYGLEDVQEIIDYAHKQTLRYGQATIAMNAQMYNDVVEMEELNLKPAEVGDPPKYSKVAETVNGTLKKTTNPKEIGASVSRLVKLVGEETMVSNAQRDKAEVAWIPHGDTCPYCISMAAQGWMPAGYLKGGEHIHPNCDCTYMVRHKENFKVKGYDPEKYRRMYDEGADVPYENENMSHAKHERLSTQKINGMRRKAYAEKKQKLEKLNLSKAEQRKFLNNSSAEEINVN